VARITVSKNARYDLNGDCVVDRKDRDFVKATLTTTNETADVDGSGLVDSTDLAIVESNFGPVTGKIC
jgi:hypothetical protein